MAMSTSSLKARIIAEIGNKYTILSAADLDKVAEALAKAVVDEIQANAVVTSNGATLAHSIGAPATITNLPGTVS